MTILAGCSGGRVGAETQIFKEVAKQHEKIALVSLSEGSRDRLSLDAGIVFASEGSYLCFPVSSFGIEQANVVQRVESSCSCVRPTLVRFLNELRQPADSIRVDFIPEITELKSLPSDLRSFQPSQLSVELRLYLDASEIKVISLNFLVTEKSNQSALEGTKP